MTTTSKQHDFYSQLLASMGVMAILVCESSAGSFAVRERPAQAESVIRYEPKNIAPICFGNDRKKSEPKAQASTPKMNEICNQKKGGGHEATNDNNA